MADGASQSTAVSTALVTSPNSGLITTTSLRPANSAQGHAARHERDLKIDENFRKLPASKETERTGLSVPHTLQFGEFALDPDRRSLERDGRDLALRPQAMEVLCYLAKNPGRTVPKEELFQKIWPGISVTDDSLVQCIR